MRIFLTLLLAAGLFVGCGGAEEAAQSAADMATEHAGDAIEHAENAADAVKDAGASALAAAMEAHSGETVVAGTVGCGHCTFSQGEGCSVALKTLDGKVVILEGVSEDTEAFNERFSGKPIAAVGVMTEGEGDDASTLVVRNHKI